MTTGGKRAPFKWRAGPGRRIMAGLVKVSAVNRKKNPKAPKHHFKPPYSAITNP